MSRSGIGSASDYGLTFPVVSGRVKVSGSLFSERGRFHNCGYVAFCPAAGLTER
jgi:hypothetical protein